MRIFKTLLVAFVIFLLSSCGSNQDLYNFSPRKDATLISEDNLIVIDYKTNTDGKLVELSIDRLLTIEQMIILNPIIDFDYELAGFTGDIFIKPNNICTTISNDLLIPVNLEVGNTRYKYNDKDCMYQTVDNHNEFKPGFSNEYLLTDTIAVASYVEISIIVYNPGELVNFIEIYNLSNTFKTIGIYNILVNNDENRFNNDLVNYYNDISILEQLYLKYQESETTFNEVMGISTDINLMDLDHLTESIPLIEKFQTSYKFEIAAIIELEGKIGIIFEP